VHMLSLGAISHITTAAQILEFAKSTNSNVAKPRQKWPNGWHPAPAPRRCYRCDTRLLLRAATTLLRDGNFDFFAWLKKERVRSHASAAASGRKPLLLVRFSNACPALS